MDVKAQAQAKTASAMNAKFLAPGHRIIGVQYRKVKFAGWRKADVGSAFLDRNSRWEKYTGDAHTRGEKIEIIEATFDDSNAEKDLKEMGINYKVYRVDTGEGFDILLVRCHSLSMLMHSWMIS
jgi:hypothetical protein